MKCFYSVQSVPLLLCLWIHMARASDPRCVQDLEICPPGHYMKDCVDAAGENGQLCQQCPEGTFQPDENRYPDKCRLTRLCEQPYMEYKDFGNTIKDAECSCVKTHHFEGDDQRACVPNQICDKGFGQGTYGQCDRCIDKNMYSDRKDNSQRCMPLTDCEKESRCTVRKSNGTFDTECGPFVEDVKTCDSLLGRDQDLLKIILPVIVVCVLLILLFVFCILRYRRRKRALRHLVDAEIPRETIDTAISKIVEFSKKDDVFCRKASQLCDRRVEMTIGRQNWALAQDLFRHHPKTGKYEVIVQTYKDVPHPEEVKGYLKEWHDWKDNCPEAIAALLRSLRNISREDIVLDICRRVNTDAGDIGVDIPSRYHNGGDKKAFHFTSLLPCTKRRANNSQISMNGKNNENLRTVKPLLDEGRANNDDDDNSEGNSSGPLQPSAPIMAGSSPLDRQESVPIQASS
ncbi:uncharacterized protein LOC135475342 isoform X2 [Liolophura sinensis]|uniref:uncharacterized protein LOC135475342 isoform X2 n=1 Tax=Liolophura sinensis TaxID=3198878 RepID=UPI0031589F20